jgi:hypothetical protein
MNKRFHAVPWIVGITAGLLLALMIVPATRLIMKLEFRAAILRDGSIFNMDNMEQVAARYPDDIDIQIGLYSFPQRRMAQYDATERTNFILQKISQFVAKFPDQPVIYAVALKQLSMLGVNTGRDSDQTLPPGNTTAIDIRQQDLLLLKKYDAYCAAGEKLDTQNAYFPFMRSVSLFAMKRDSEALQEIESASQKPVYNDYSSLQFQSIMKLADKIAGGKNALVRAMAYAGILCPEYSAMRASARIALHEAILMEKHGNLQGGFVIRQALRRYGSLMTADSTFDIGNLVGGAISKMAMNYLPGAPPNANSYGDMVNHSFLNHYITYLNQIHHPEEAAACIQQVKLMDTIHNVVKNNIFSIFS